MNKKGSAELQGRLTILVRPYQGRYIALCKEAGIIREAPTFQEAKEAIIQSVGTLLREAEKDPNALESLNLGLSWEMHVFFYWSVLRYLVIRMVHDTFLMTSSASQFPRMPQLAHV